MFHHNKLTSAMPHTQQHKNVFETIKVFYSTLVFRYNVGIFFKYHPYELWAIIYVRQKNDIDMYLMINNVVLYKCEEI